ncbi:MAG TPA: F0F1 ATP synthase subunit B [Alphaproteobacteria bacterium]|nr:F0F1 ATP synthase subunit B [Alphaproteobacteria bacterium]
MELFHDPEFWVLVGFLIFFGLLGRTFWKLMRDGLDGRAAKVKEQLAEATRLRTEAQQILESYRQKQNQAVKDAADILQAAKEEAERMRLEGEAELKRSIAAREAQAKDRIAQAEQAAIQSVKALAADIAIRAATSLVAESIDKDGAAALVDQAIDDLPKRAA